MRLKFFYTLLFLVCLSTVASSNERARNCRPGYTCPTAAGDSVKKVKVRVSVAPIATSLPILRLLSI